MVVLSKIYACAVVISDSEDNEGSVIMCRSIEKGKEVLRNCYENEMKESRADLDNGLLVDLNGKIEDDECFAEIFVRYHTDNTYITQYRLMSILMDEQEFDYLKMS